MKNEDPIIIWEKWQDPFLEKINTETNSEEEGLSYEEMYENNNNYGEQHSSNIKFPMIVTPMGILPYNENTACGKLFNFWVGHTNFDIDRNIQSIIEKCAGVETLDIFTRYRFRISIGKAFKDSIIMRYLNSKTYEYIEKQ